MSPYSHGHWSLKGVAEPVELFSLSRDEPDLRTPSDSDKAYRVGRRNGQWVALRDVPHNLPEPSSSFVGRQAEVAWLRRRLPDARLVTLIGMGGIGKTRLALRAAAEVRCDFVNGLWFVDLAELRDPALVPATLAHVLDVREAPGSRLTEALTAALRDRRSLIVLDNCEHLLDACAKLAQMLLSAAPRLCVLATSREPLHLPGEQVFAVKPLDLPESVVDFAELRATVSVRLLEQRVLAQRPDFEFEAQDGPVLRELLVRLEGIPLLIELAAARLRTLGLAELNMRLRDRFALLRGGVRGMPTRQETLRALIDWSYELLAANEKVALNRMSLFAGSFDLAAAEAICTGGTVSTDDVLDLTQALLDKSLLVRGDDGRSPRFRMLTTIREYARECLGGGAEAKDAARRHCDHYFAMSKVVCDGLASDLGMAIRLAEANLDNLRAAMATALGGGAEPFTAPKFAVRLMNFWILRGYLAEGRAWVRDILVLPAVQASDLAHAHMLYVGAGLAGAQGDHAESCEQYQRCLTLRRSNADPQGVAAALAALAYQQVALGQIDAAGAGLREALGLFSDASHSIGVATVLTQLGQVALYCGDLAEAVDRFGDALRLAHRLNHREIQAEVELGLGLLARRRADPAQASAHAQASLAICRDSGDRRGEARALALVAALSLDGGDWEAASATSAQALRVCRDCGLGDQLLEVLELRARLALGLGRPTVAAGLAGAVEGARERMGLARSQAARADWDDLRRLVHADPDLVGVERAWATWRHGPIDAAIDAAGPLGA